MTSSKMTSQVEPAPEFANGEQAQAWNGDEGRRWAAYADRYERVNRRHTQRLFERAGIGPNDAVLDVGCGTGGVTRDAARLATHSSALGVDLSAVMLEHAREQSRAEGVTNASFVQADAQLYAFTEHSFDVAISSFGVMFFADPEAAFANIGAALRPGARVAFLVWRELGRNEWVTEVRTALAVGRQLPEPPPGVPSPFALADPDRVRTVLRAAGYEDIEFESIDEPAEFGADADEAFAFMRTLGIAEGLTRELDDARRAEAFAALQRSVASHAGADGVLFGASAWLITACRP